MAKPSQVPKFGNWESEEDVSYTAYFDSPRKHKKTSKVNQIDSHENRKTESTGRKASHTSSPRHNHLPPQVDGETRRSTEMIEPGHHRGLSRDASESPHHRHGLLSAGDMPRRVSRQSLGPDRSVEHSPLHPHLQVRVGGNGSRISSPSWERKATYEASYGLAPSTPGRFRMRSVTRGDNTPDRSLAVPKFGDWDETNPASAEGYSQIFNRVIEEKHGNAEKVLVMPTETAYPNGKREYGNDNPKGCGCFPWGKR